jgi:glutamine amidotransferase
MQVLFSESHEFGVHRGLGLIPGKVLPIPRRGSFKVPHVGWSAIRPSADGCWHGTVLERVHPSTRAYFVHSLAAIPDVSEDRLAETDYGGFCIPAAVRRRSVTGCQFHPEKSGPAGLAILRRFLEI